MGGVAEEEGVEDVADAEILVRKGNFGEGAEEVVAAAVEEDGGMGMLMVGCRLRRR